MQVRLTPVDVLYISLGGMLGSLLRWWVGFDYAGTFPVPTILINILGAVALGILHGSQHQLHPQGRYLYMVGFCGSFTTVSLFSLETIQLVEAGQTGTALANLFLPVVLSLLIVALIIGPVERFVERRHS